MVDPIIDNWSEIMISQAKIINAVGHSDEEKRNKIKLYIQNEVLQFHLLAENHLELSHGKFMVGNEMTIADFVMVSYIANVVKNVNSPFSAVTTAVMERTPLFLAYSERLMTEFEEILRLRPEPTPF
mmetsp:Transcript_11690/g.15866  ORF Transcript_11690/g.15866 Transcript_11690/m.15866 type:complete len:127 (+) Transcript_11690:372-752(+)